MNFLAYSSLVLLLDPEWDSGRRERRSVGRCGWGDLQREVLLRVEFTSGMLTLEARLYNHQLILVFRLRSNKESKS